MSRNAEAARWERMFGEEIMIGIQQELTQLQAEFAQLVARWNGMDRGAQAKAWTTYTQSLDEGASGYHPFGRLLVAAWCEGWSAIGGVALDSEGSLRPKVSGAA